MRYATVVALGVSIIAGGVSSFAHAQLPMRTWVSGVGTDANPLCTRTAPCQTFAGAILKTGAGGEIGVLDPGSYGTLNITKSITIDGSGTLASITSTGDVGITVNGGTNDVVVLRNLNLNGAGTGSIGVRFVAGKQLIIENTRISGFLSRGVLVPSEGFVGTGTVVISNSTISTTSDPASFAIGIHSQQGITTVSHSVITGNWIGLFAENTGVINADSNVLTGNVTALNTNGSTATLRISNNDVYGNQTGFGCGSGVLASAGNNRKGNNTGGTGPACAPSAAISQQ